MREAELKDIDPTAPIGRLLVYSYVNPRGDAAALPAAFIMSDSFFQKGSSPHEPDAVHFRAVKYYLNSFMLDGWDDAGVIILSHSDQSARGIAGVVNALVHRLVTRPRK